MEASLLKNQLGGCGTLATYLRAGRPAIAVWDFDAAIHTAPWSLTRASGASYFDASGLQTVTANAARYVPAGTGRALKIEPATTNRLNPAQTSAVALSAVAAGPVIGGVALTRVTDDDGAGYLQFNEAAISGLSIGTILTFSCILHAGASHVADLWIGIGTTGAARTGARYDLVAQTAIINRNADNTAPVATLRALGNGLFEASLRSKIITGSDSLELCRLTGVIGSIDYALPQIETSNSATSRVLPPATSRSAEVLSLTAPAGVFDAVLTDGSDVETVTRVTLAGGNWQPTTGPTTLKRVALYSV